MDIMYKLIKQFYKEDAYIYYKFSSVTANTWTFYLSDTSVYIHDKILVFAQIGNGLHI